MPDRTRLETRGGGPARRIAAPVRPLADPASGPGPPRPPEGIVWKGLPTVSTAHLVSAPATVPVRRGAGRPLPNRRTDRDRTASPNPVRRLRPVNAAPESRTGDASAGQPREARGFVFYVGLDEAKAELDGTTLVRLVEELKQAVGRIAPHAETHAAVALAPRGAGGRDVDVVRLALQDPQALAEHAAPEREAAEQTGVVIDTSRRRVLVDGRNAELTYREFELLQALVLREGRTVGREEIIDVLWRQAQAEQPNERTIDVHVRRLRAKLGDYGEIVRTVRGTGYRFDRHADVEVVHGIGRSPDRF